MRRGFKRTVSGILALSMFFMSVQHVNAQEGNGASDFKKAEEIAEILGADSLGYLDINRLGELIDGDTGYCHACFSGEYPVDPPKQDIRGDYER